MVAQQLGTKKIGILAPPVPLVVELFLLAPGLADSLTALLTQSSLGYLFRTTLPMSLSTWPIAFGFDPKLSFAESTVYYGFAMRLMKEATRPV